MEVTLRGVDYQVLLVESEPLAYDRFYNVIANPILWFIQHYLWDLSNAPDIRRDETDAWSSATRWSTATSRRRSCARSTASTSRW